MISIIIPAHDEESVIGRCLRRLVERPVSGGLEVIVVCNGCRDRTAQIARTFGPPVVVVETQEASKTAALNLGDSVARGFPRVYLDADVEVSLDAVERVAEVLGSGTALAAAPAIRVDTTGASALVKAFYRIWLQLPYHNSGMIGSGFYALSEEGRGRFDHFPRVIADDEFVRSHFQQEQRATATDCTFTIHAPRNTRDLVRIKTRGRLGLYELRSRFPHLASSSRQKARLPRNRVLLHPRLWFSALVYLAVNIATRVRALRQIRRIDGYKWERDDSSRQPPAPDIVD